MYLCRWYYLAGFLFLPFLWAINSFWFYHEAFKKPPFQEQKDIKTYVIRSAIGASIWFIGLLAWIITFQINRSSWGELGDQLSFVIPTGRA
ncbi:unnamed protein product [Allacma fusca]|uniref:Gamma-secretase subunit PEN-2 n=1 Tax=Allacma fusca TaxID=39272 RepID=A0A8J2JFY3_9HEXA|nr:unnamed protein product [Allacma fusca]